ncbi:MAG: hypothetical protein K9H26_06420 [Prolixibacteraceae bacterium]|nr:hypothetical protein [Prolixibacteraceae bacterium]
MKRYIITVTLSLLSVLGFSQDFFDAVKFAQTGYGGTARSIAMGSAFGSLGADFSSASINPAGMGLYRSGEFTLSPTLNINGVTAAYLGKERSDRKYNFNFNNLSYVTTANTGVESGIVSVTIGLGYNRLKNFHSNISVYGEDAQTSLLSEYSDNANYAGHPDYFNDFNEGLARNAFLIGEDPDLSVIEGIYYDDLSEYSDRYEIWEDGEFIGYGYERTGVSPHNQRSMIERSGRIDEYLLSLGMNINHKVFFGASLGLVDIEYRENTAFTEEDNYNVSDYLNYYTQTSNIYHSGMGVNFKAGIIYRPFKSLRLGAAIHTPTFYSINFGYEKEIDAYFDQEVGDEEMGYSTSQTASVSDYYDYNFETPLRAVFSGSYQFGNVGLISVDYELINYATSKFRHAAGDNYDYSPQNNEIQKNLKATGNLHVGGEMRITPSFSLRGGFEMFGNPWNQTYTFEDGTTGDVPNYNDVYLTYSAGFGYRQQHFFIDFAYRLNQITEKYQVHYMYYSNGENIASLSEFNNQATLTLGYRF